MPKLSEINGKPEEFIKTIYEYAKNPFGFLLISGKNGNGKTFSAKAIYENFYHPEPFDDKLFFTQTDLNLKWQKNHKDYGDNLPFLEELIKVKLLVLDDLGTRTPTEPFVDFLYAIADKRYTNKSSCGTIVTTNLNGKDMRERFGDAFGSRIASGKCIRWDGPDRRFIDF